MKFNSTSGRIITVNLENAARSKRPENASSPQRHVREVLTKLFPGIIFYEDFYVDGLFLDFFGPSLQIVIEVDGDQHDKFNKFFHRNGAGFTRHALRDGRKEQFCEINNITLVRIPQAIAFNEDKILERIQHELEC